MASVSFLFLFVFHLSAGTNGSGWELCHLTGSNGCGGSVVNRPVCPEPERNSAVIFEAGRGRMDRTAVTGSHPLIICKSAYIIHIQLQLVLPTVPGYPAAVRVVTRKTGVPTRVRGRFRTGPRFHFTVHTTWAPIKYLSFYRIMTWSIGKLSSFSRSFTSCIQICNPTDIR